ncbi:MAG: hypothetical protein QXU18_05315 [Thermoplasmatales archaeon]
MTEKSIRDFKSFVEQNLPIPLKSLIVSSPEQMSEEEFLAKLIFLANLLPTTFDIDDAFYSRSQIIEFSNQFIQGLTMDQNVLDSLTVDSMLSGLFNRSVIALRSVLKNGKFTSGQNAEERKTAYKIRSNPFKVFCEKYLGTYLDEPSETVGAEDIRVMQSEIKDAFNGFCSDNGIPPWSAQRFFKSLNKYLLNFGINPHRDSKTGRQYYLGLYLRIETKMSAEEREKSEADLRELLGDLDK